MPFKIVRNDITKMQVDAIVNAANTELKMGGGVCGAIFSAAGPEALERECRRIGGCEIGQAVVTQAYRLPARYIIHTPGPIWQGGKHSEAQLLRSCYISALELALEHKCKSIAFPLISSGIFGYPKEDALNTAVLAIRDFLETNEMMIYLVVFDKKAFVISQQRFLNIERYIDNHYVKEHEIRRRYHNNEYLIYEELEALSLAAPVSKNLKKKCEKRHLDELVNQLDESFSEMLLRLIVEKGMEDVEVYKRANIDRKLFSKIRSNREYKPSKGTAIAFAVALYLSVDEALDLLSRAGFTLSHSSKFDIIIEYFLSEQQYNIFEINETLFAFDQPLLGA